MIEEDILNKIEILRGLKQNKTKTDKQLREIAVASIEAEKYKVNWTGLTAKEKKEADNIYQSYIDNHHIEGFNDLEDLKTLVYNAILENRLKEKIFKLNKNEEIPSKYLMDSLTGLQNQILNVKKKLGLNETKQEGWLEFWTRFLKKIHKYSATHKGAFYFRCGKCGKMYLLAKKVEDYNTFDFNMFRGTFTYSEEVMKMIDEKLIDFDRASKIMFNIGKEYLQGMYEKIYLKEKNEKLNQG